MTGASIETTLELWASSLRDVKARMRGLFTQERVAASVNLFLDGLLGDERRKTGWMRAEAAGDPGPWRQQAILGCQSACKRGSDSNSVQILHIRTVSGQLHRGSARSTRRWPRKHGTVACGYRD